MAQVDLEDFIRRFYDSAFKDPLRPDALGPWLAPDFEDHSTFEVDGLEGLPGVVVWLRSGLEDISFEVEVIPGDGDWVAGHWRLRGRPLGLGLGIGPPDDQEVVVSGMDVFRVVDGRIAEHWGAVDPLEELVRKAILDLGGRGAGPGDEAEAGMENGEHGGAVFDIGADGGANVGGNMSIEPPPSPKPEPPPAPVASAPPPPEPGGRSCPRCGASVDARRTYCPTCGERLGQGAVEAEPMAEPPSPPPRGRLFPRFPHPFKSRRRGHRARPPTKNGGDEDTSFATEAAVEAEPPPATLGATAEPPKAEPATEASPRWIQVEVTTPSDGQERDLTGRGFLAEAVNTVYVMIGRVEDWPGALAAVGAPEESVDAKLPTGQANQVTLMFFVPSLSEVQSQKVTLPADGPSQIVDFGLIAPPAGQQVTASISLIHQDRVLQTAILTGWSLQDPDTAPAGFEMTFKLAVIKPALTNLETRTAFDGAIISQEADGTLAAAGVRDGKHVTFDRQRLGLVVDKVRSRLATMVDVANVPLAADNSASVDLMRGLAFQGRDLYDILGTALEEASGKDLQKIQVSSTEAGDFVPVEFVYDFPVPALDAGLCPNWQKALAQGTCDPANHPPATQPGQSTKVCPLGFWGLKKVIERQVITPRGPDGSDAGDGTPSEPTAGQNRLPELTAALFAWSDRVDKRIDGQSAEVLATLNQVTGNGAKPATTWDEWVGDVGSRHPSLLVLLSHTVNEQGSSALEIGPEDHGSRLVRQALFPAHVKTQPTDNPVVLLLGCDTAVARSDPESFVARFRRIGAAVVVGTLSPVLGEHAAPVASAIIRELRAMMDRSDGEGVSLGEALRDVRRALLAKGEMTALCVTSFGDADWRLGGAAG